MLGEIRKRSITIGHLFNAQPESIHLHPTQCSDDRLPGARGALNLG